MYFISSIISNINLRYLNKYIKRNTEDKIEHLQLLFMYEIVSNKMALKYKRIIYFGIFILSNILCLYVALLKLRPYFP